MFCAANYAFFDVRSLADQGLYGAGALGLLHTPGDSWAVALLDESNCFTRVIAPEWLVEWQALPPLRAGEV